MANLLNALFLILFFWGRSLRFKNLRLHILVMLVVMVCDLALVGGLVVFRNALSKVDMGMHWTLFVHIPFAVSTVVLYPFTAWAGYRLWKGDENARPRLRALDQVLVVMRVMTLVTALILQFMRPV